MCPSRWLGYCLAQLRPTRHGAATPTASEHVGKKPAALLTPAHAESRENPEGWSGKLLSPSFLLPFPVSTSRLFSLSCPSAPWLLFSRPLGRQPGLLACRLGLVRRPQSPGYPLRLLPLLPGAWSQQIQLPAGPQTCQQGMGPRISVREPRARV